MSRLDIFRDEEFVTEKVLMRASVSLGRHPENDIVLDDRTLSRFHARVERRGDRYVVIDLGAQNGVYLNGTRIVGESHLTPGDRIGVGRYVAIFDRPNAGKGRTRRERRSPGGGALELDGSGTVTNADLDIDVSSLSSEPEAVADEFGFDDGTTSVNKKDGPVFVLLYNGLEVSRYPVAGEMIIGRSKNSEIVISLLGLSRKHAKITVADDAVLVEDLGSQNGTWVNHVQVEGRRALQHGDLLNFYEYGLLYLEDADAEVDLPGAEFSKDESGESALEIQETGRRGAPTWQGKAPRPPTEKSPVPLLDSEEEPPPPAGDNAGLDAFGAGALFPEVEDEDEHDRTNTTPVREDFSSSSMGFSSELDDGLKQELESFSESGLDFEDDSYVDRTAHSLRVQPPVGDKRGTWPSDDELDEALRKRVKAGLVVVEVSLDGKPYTQMPLTLPVTRIGTDARCELALPKGAGLAKWQLTLVNFKGCVVCYRASANARVLLDDVAIDQAVLKSGDELVLGRVKLTLRVK